MAGSQVNAVLSLTMLPAIVVGHEDGHIRIYDSARCEFTLFVREQI